MRFAFLIFAPCLLAQGTTQAVTKEDAHAQAARVRAAMRESIEKQRTAIREQARIAGASVPYRAATAPAFACEPIAAPELARMIDSVSKRNSIDSSLVREVARQESGFRPCVVSPKGAEGIMQLMPGTQAQLEVKDPFNPEENLAAGAKLLKQLLDRYKGDMSLALSAYNAGSGRVDRANGVPDIPETKSYVMEILRRILPQ